MKQYAYVKRLPVTVGTFSTFCVVVARSFPFLPLLRRYAFLLRKTSETTATVKGLCLQRTADAGVIYLDIFPARITTADSPDIREFQKSRLSLHSLQY